MGCLSVLRSPCFPLVLLLFIDSSSKYGLTKGIGVLFHDLSIDIPMTSTDLGIALGLLISVGNVASPILVAAFNRCSHPRFFMLVGTLMSPCCIILASFATSKYTVFVSFAIAGLGNMTLRMPSILTLNGLAGEKFNVLYSLSTCGYSLGMALYPLMADALLSAYGWRGVLLIFAGIMLHTIPCLMAIQVPLRDGTSRHGAELENNSSSDDAGFSAENSNYQEADDTNKDSDSAPLMASPNMDGYGAPLRDCLHSLIDGTQNIWKWFRSTMIYTDPISLFILLSFMSLQFVTSGWISFLVPHAVQRGITLRNIVFLTFCAAVGNISARFSVAFLTHRLIRPINLYLALTIMNIFALTIDAYIPNFIVMLMTTSCSSLCIAGRSVLGILVLRERASADHVSMALAVMEGLGGSAVYLGGYISGLVADVFASYDASFKLLALVDVLTFILMVPPRKVKKTESYIQQSN